MSVCVVSIQFISDKLIETKQQKEQKQNSKIEKVISEKRSQIKTRCKKIQRIWIKEKFQKEEISNKNKMFELIQFMYNQKKNQMIIKRSRNDKFDTPQLKRKIHIENQKINQILINYEQELLKRKNSRFPDIYRLKRNSDNLFLLKDSKSQNTKSKRNLIYKLQQNILSNNDLIRNLSNNKRTIDIYNNKQPNLNKIQRFSIKRNHHKKQTLTPIPRCILLLLAFKYNYQHYVLTKAGCQFGNISKTNQDNFIIYNYKNYEIYGICDGHGLNGHHVSKFLRFEIPNNFEKAIKNNFYTKNSLNQIIINCFKMTNDQLLKLQFDTFLSGSTLICLIFHKNQLYVANVGDSRAIMVSHSNTIINLSEDQKPSLSKQKERIIQVGGRIDFQRDQNGQPLGPLRVWMAKSRMPGLAMTRSFGDKAGIEAGIIAVPEIKHFLLQKQYKYAIIASDGLWQYMTNQQVQINKKIVQILNHYYNNNDIYTGCEVLMNRTIQAWKKVQF